MKIRGSSSRSTLRPDPSGVLSVLEGDDDRPGLENTEVCDHLLDAVFAERTMRSAAHAHLDERHARADWPGH